MFPRYARLTLAAATAGAALASSALADTQLIGHIAPAQPVGWSDLVVPAIAPGSIGTQPLTTPLELLPGQSLYFNWAVGHNASINGTWVDALLVDGVLVAAHPRHNPVFVGKTWFALDDGPYALSGGRHTLTVHSDLYAQTNEESLDRGDNVQSVSYVWRPEALAAGTTATTFAPPEAGNGPQPNGHAVSFVPPGVDPFGIAVLSPSGDLVV
jgi:hypothetical protein